jgi:hypothetical protein
MIIVNIASEDELSEVIAAKLIDKVVPGGKVGLRLRKDGSGYLRSSLHKFCQMARREYVLLLTDLDKHHCAPGLIATWTGGQPLPAKLLFRVPVREIEAWLLADRLGFAQLMQVDEARVPPDPDTLPDPKQALLTVARHAARSVRVELIASRGALASQGLGYNRVLSNYIETVWDIDRAAERSPSLRRLVVRLAALVQ